MTGVIWVIQLVHYPIFDRIEAGDSGAAWVQFARHHTRSISFVVGPFMLAEGVTGLWLVVAPPADAGRVLAMVALVLMGVAYGTTAFVSAPIHGRLADRFDAGLHRRLVSTNWIRTAAWTLRAAVVLVIALVAMT